jgi:two-component system sensor kinase FixL
MFAGSTFKEQRDASRARIEFGEIVQILDNSPAIHLFRIAQEALNNATKHGHAKTVVIALESSDGIISLRVSDDGIGFDPTRSALRGMGLNIMRYRARMIGGWRSSRALPRAR